MDKYTLPFNRRNEIVRDQIEECQTMIYRNNLENLNFIKKNDEDKQVEVATNNKILRNKIDLLSTELEGLNNEDSGGVTEPGAAV